MGDQPGSFDLRNQLYCPLASYTLPSLSSAVTRLGYMLQLWSTLNVVQWGCGGVNDKVIYILLLATKLYMVIFYLNNMSPWSSHLTLVFGLASMEIILAILKGPDEFQIEDKFHNQQHSLLQ